MANEKSWISFVFTVLPKHIKIKSLLKCKTVCGRLLKTLVLSPALISYGRPVRGSSPDGALFTYNFFFKFN